jgi:hypothetical protein
MVMWYILWSFGIVYGHLVYFSGRLVYFIVIWYILQYFWHFGMFSPVFVRCTKTNLATPIITLVPGWFGLSCGAPERKLLLPNSWRRETGHKPLGNIFFREKEARRRRLEAISWMRYLLSTAAIIVTLFLSLLLCTDLVDACAPEA